MRASSVLLSAIACAGLLIFSSCATSTRYAGGDWDPATGTRRHTRPPERSTGALPSVPFRAEVLAVGTSPLRYERPIPVATRTIAIQDAPPTFTPAPPASHVVEPGETLIAIARNELGDASRWRDIVAVNPGLNPSEIKAGQRLKLPN